MRATPEDPSTPHHFAFLTDEAAPVGVGSVVRVRGGDRTVFAVVVDASAYRAPLGEPVEATAETAASAVREVRCWMASVLRHVPEEPLQPVPVDGEVWLATREDLPHALRMESYLHGERATGIPVGLYGVGNDATPVWLDADFLLGPEAAHLNLSGISGLATKTSAITFLLSSVFQTFPAHKGRVAAVCFNVKGSDLCFLDQPAPLGAEDLALWARLGLQPVPFADVQVYAPLRADGVTLNTLRSHPALIDAVEPLTWGLREVLDYAEVVLNRDDLDAKADAFVDFLADRVVGREFHAPELQDAPFRVSSFAELEGFFRAILNHLEGRRGGEIWRTHHAATIRKVRNRLGNIVTRARGLVTDDADVSDLPWGAFRDRSVTVLDLAGVDPLAQDLVFARVIARLREELERRTLGVEHVVVVVDELNKYAPADGEETHVRRMLLDLSERGRYLGLVLFSAQQFRSQVLRRVTGNAGTALYGRMDADELALPGYATLSPAIRAKLAALPKGELMVRHPHFTHPIFVRFPRPASLSGRDGVERFPPAVERPLVDGVLLRLRRVVPGLSAAVVQDLVEGRPDADVARALTLALRSGQAEPLEVFRRALRGVVTRTPPPASPHRPSLAHPGEDPFAPY